MKKWDLSNLYYFIHKHSALREGDYVRVTKPFQGGEFGCSLGFPSIMHKSVGRTFQILKKTSSDFLLDTRSVIGGSSQCGGNSSNGFYYPWFVLERVDGKG